MLRFLVALGFVAISWGAPQDLYSLDPEERIVNGTDAEEGEYPYQISLQKKGKHSCGGSILNQNFILTAAHCIVSADPINVTIEVGTTELGNGKSYGVEKLIPHAEYDAGNYYIHDIGIVKLNEPLSYGYLVQPVPLPLANQQTPGGTAATLTGWGIPYTNGSVMQTLQTVDYFIVSDEECLEIHSTNDMFPYPSNICAGYPGGGKGQCSGDSGGPLMANGVQVGIVSWSHKPCAVGPYPGVFTEVSYYIDWIKEHSQ